MPTFTRSNQKPVPKQAYQNRIRKLVAALRSKRYRQTRGALRRISDDDLSYCCLGVACEVFRLATRTGRWIGRSEFSEFRSGFGISTGGSTTTLPPIVANWYRLNPDPQLRLTPRQAKAAKLKAIERKQAVVTATTCNDKLRYTFSQIANAFERTYLTRRTPRKKKAA